MKMCGRVATATALLGLLLLIAMDAVSSGGIRGGTAKRLQQEQEMHRQAKDSSHAYNSPYNSQKPRQPTRAPTRAPSKRPASAQVTSLSTTGKPSKAPSPFPTFAPSAAPTAGPTMSPSASPTSSPSSAPSTHPTRAPTSAPTAAPTTAPTAAPTASPSSSPSSAPTASPSATPTAAPTASPSAAPSSSPSSAPTASPSAHPTRAPSPAPTAMPSNSPTAMPTLSPTVAPTVAPTAAPLLLYYAFNETAGSTKVVDYSGSGFDATTQNGPSFSGTFMRLRSSSRQYLSINNALGTAFKALDSFTVTLSMRYPQLSPMERPRIFSFGVLGDTISTALFAYDRVGPHGPTYYVINPDKPGEHNCRSRALPIDYNAFYSITVTYDGPSNTVKTYRNGEEVGSCEGYPHKPSGQPLSTSLFIGRSTHPIYHEYLDAEFKCFRMYNRALSAQEVVRDTCHTGLFGVAPA